MQISQGGRFFTPLVLLFYYNFKIFHKYFDDLKSKIKKCIIII
jgi:hypothetical protein